MKTITHKLTRLFPTHPPNRDNLRGGRLSVTTNAFVSSWLCGSTSKFHGIRSKWCQIHRKGINRRMGSCVKMWRGSWCRNGWHWMWCSCLLHNPTVVCYSLSHISWVQDMTEVGCVSSRVALGTPGLALSGCGVKTKNGQTGDWTQDPPDIYQML